MTSCDLIKPLFMTTVCKIIVNSDQFKKNKIFLKWRGSPREATGLIRNELPRLNYNNKILTEIYSYVKINGRATVNLKIYSR